MQSRQQLRCQYPGEFSKVRVSVQADRVSIFQHNLECRFGEWQRNHIISARSGDKVRSLTGADLLRLQVIGNQYNREQAR